MGIALLWWAVLAVILVLYQRGKEKAKAQAAAEEEARRQQFLAEWDRRQAAEEERQRQALEQAKGTGHLFLEDGEVDAWCGVTPDGEQCHHRHRSPQAASECAAKHMSLAAWAVITLPSSS
jgi:hypothetical protein